MEDKQPDSMDSVSGVSRDRVETSPIGMPAGQQSGSAFWHHKSRLMLVITLVLVGIVGVMLAFFTSMSSLTKKADMSVYTAGSYDIQNIPLDEFTSLDDFGLSTSQSLSINGQLFVNNSLTFAPISQPITAQAGQLYYDRAANGLTYYNGSQYLTVANSGQIASLRAELQSVDSRIPTIPAIPTIPSDLATLGADNLFQGFNTFDGGINTGELRVDGVTVLGATTISNLLLSSPLSVGSGGTGTNSLMNNGVLIGQGTSPVTAVTAASAGLCLMSTGGTPVFGVCPGGSFSGVNSINGVNGSLTLNNTTASGTTLTINDASATNKGIARFGSVNFVVSAGVVDTVQNISTTSSPTFNSITVNSVAAASDLTVSAGTNGNLALATSGSGALYFSGYDCSAAGGGGKLTVDAGGKVVCGADNDTPTPGDGEGITSVGVIDSQPKSASGAVIVGSTIYLQTADVSNLGLVSTGIQTFAGAKTFESHATFNNGVSVNGDIATSGQINTATITGGSLSATTVNDLAVSSNAISAVGSLAVTSATNSNLTLATSGSGALYLSGYDCSGLAGNGKLTVDATGRVTCAADTDTDTDTGLTTIVAGSGIRVVNNNEVSIQLRAGYGLAFDAVSPYGVGLTSCATNQILKSNGSGWDCAVDNDTPTPGDGQGITTIGVLDGGNVSANGASVSADGSTIYLQSASPLRNGLVTTGAQTFVGSKSFNDSITANAGIAIASGQTITLGTVCGAGQVLTTNASGVVMCITDSEGTDTGVTTVGSIDSQAKNSNGAVINGSAIYLQTADASSVGLVSTSAQTFSGAKTFNGVGSFLSGLSVTGNLGVTGTINTATITGGTISGGSLSATMVNDLTVSSNAITATAALTVTTADNQNLTLATSGSGSLYLSGYNCSAFAGGGKLTVDASGKVACAADTDTDTDTTGITSIVAGNGIQVTGGNQVSVQLRSGYGLAFDAVSPYGVGLTSCATNQILKSNGSGWDCAVDSDTTTPGDGQGITTVGALDGGTASADGASVSANGSTIYLQSASALRTGLVTTSAQTFAGAKTFANGITASDLISANGGITIASGQNVTLGLVCTAGQVLTTNASGVVTCIADNEGIDTDTGVTAVGAVDSQTKHANGAVIVGSTIYLQTADASNIGLMSTGTQTFAGAKTFNGVGNFMAGLNVTGTLSVSSTINGATIAGGSLSPTAVNGLGVSSNTITSSGALTVTAASNQNLTLAISGSGSLYMSGYNCSALAGGGKLTVDVNGRVSCSSDYDTDTTGITTIVAGNGINVTNGNQVSVQLRSGYGLAFDAVSPYGVGLTSCATNQILKSNGSGWDCASDSDTPTPGDGQGITTVGAIDGGIASADGASVSGDGTTLYLQSASALRTGLVTTGAQTFAGAKTFNGLITANGSLAVAAGQTVTLGSACGAGQVLGTNGSGVITCVTDGTGTDTGVTVVGGLDNQTRNANGATIVGNTIYLQTADVLNPGLVSTGAQTFAGAKTFNDGVNIALGDFNIGGTSVITSTRTLQNVNADASIISSGTIGTARIVGAYSGIAGTGTLSSGSIGAGFGSISTGDTIQGTRIISTIATGTAPLMVASTTKVANLNVDLLDGLDSSAFALASDLSSYVRLQGVTPGTPQTGNINITGTAIAASFSGTGEALTNLNASALASGIVNTARISGSYNGVTGTGALTVGSIAAGFGTISTANTIQGTQFISSVATGTAPLVVSSTTLVASLNADMLDGKHSSDFALASSVGSYINNSTLQQTEANFNISGNGIVGSNLTVGGDTTIGGETLLAGNTTVAVTSSTALQVQNGGGVTLLTADTQNGKVGVDGLLVVGTSPVTYSLQVASAPQLEAGYRTTSFSTSQNVSTPGDSVKADFNNDGVDDLLIADAADYGGVAYIYLNTGGSMTYAATVDNLFSSFYYGSPSLVARDFDGDGDMDVAVNDYQNNRIGIFKNNGSLSFAAGVFYNVGGSPTDIAAADLDSDGDQDIAVTMYGTTNNISVLSNNGTGAFATYTVYSLAGGSLQALTIADFDGDGDRDIMASSDQSNCCSAPYDYYAKLLRNNGNGTFNATIANITAGQVIQKEIISADVDGDGDIDAVISGSANSSYKEITVLRNNGSGSFTAVAYGAYGSESGNTSIRLADNDGDGDLDIIASFRGSSDTNHRLRVYTNDGAGGFAVNTTAYSDGAGKISAVDTLNLGDGKRYLFYLKGGSPTQFVLWWSTGAPQTLLTNVGQNALARSADLNNDGQQDLVVLVAGAVKVHLKTGPGAYSTNSVTISSSFPYEAKFADVDGDSDVDIVVSRFGGITVLLNNGSGVFGAPAPADYSHAGNNAYDLGLYDLDGDGDMDAVATSYDGDALSVLKNNGNGTFASSVNFTTGDGPRGLDFGDFDKDGDMDIAVANALAGTVSILSNNGNGTFAAKVDYSTGGAALTNLVVTDVNFDGDQDILTLSTSGNSIKLLHNNGTGLFNTIAVSTFDTIANSNSMSVKDLDGDGDKDIVVGAAGTLVVHLNNGTGLFGSRTDYLTTTGGSVSYPLKPFMTDYDGDGDQDIVAAGGNGISSQYNVFAFRNTATVTSNPVSSGTLSVTTKGSGNGGVFIQGSVGQTAHLLLIQDADGTKLLAVDAAGNLSARGSILGGVGSPDYAENISASDTSIEAADVVAIDPNNSESVIKSSTPYDPTVVGVISTSPGFVTNAANPGEDDNTQRPLALSGRVPVKVTTENGPIMPGDYLTTSSTPGYAMKATEAGTVIGRAIGSFTPTDTCGAYECGRVLMFIDNSYYSPNSGAKLQGGGLALSGDVDIDGDVNITGALNVGSLASLSELDVVGDARIRGSLTVATSITTRTIIINGHIVAGGDKPTITTGPAAGIMNNSSVQLWGNDTTGSVQVTSASTNTSGGVLAKIKFAEDYENQTFNVAVTAANGPAGEVRYHVNKTADGFEIILNQSAMPNTTYKFDYIVLGAKQNTQ